MAEAFPSAILDSVLKQLEPPFFLHNKKLNCGLGKQLRDVRSKLELIRSVINDAELMGMLFPKLVRKWVCDLQCILHELDDLLDEALTHSMSESGMIEKVRLHLHNLPFDLTLACKMKDINERLEGVVKQCYKCNLLVERGPPQPSNIGGGSEKPIARKGILRYDPNDVKDDEPEMIGRDDDKKTIIKMLFDEDPRNILKITGEVGVGKTTLCRAVYDDEEVSRHFEVRLWFGPEYAKECLSYIDLWKNIITVLDEAQPNLDIGEEDSQLIEKIVSLVGTRRVLLVLDCSPPVDGYPTPFSHYFWHKVENLMFALYRGIKILVPLRLRCKDFAIMYYPSHELKNELSEEHSWSIFEKTALVPGRDREEWIEDLGKKIVSKCLGNPALLRGVGTLLHGKESKDDGATWEYFAHEFDFSSQYHHYIEMSLAHYLFQMFHQSISYLSLFSKADIKFEALINQFAANGFTKLSDKSRRELTFHFIRPIEEKADWDDEDRYEIMEWMKVQIMQLAGADFTILGWRGTDISNAARHVSILRPSSSIDQRQEENMVLTNSLMEDVIHKRSLLFLGKWHPVRMSVQTLDALASNLRYLRVLDLQDLALKELPSSIGKLIHLRYLDLSRNDFKELPRSICRLKNLQTLRLVYCDKLVRLPRRIKNLCYLSHLEVNMCLDLTHMPSNIAKLTRLRRLDRFVVGPQEGGLRYLEHLDSLNGHLTIELPRQWEKSIEDAEKAKLERKGGLTDLEFKWQGTDSGRDYNEDYDVLEKLKPCTTIESLFILSFGGTAFPSWIRLGNRLARLTISHCKRCTILPLLHGLPKLKYLTLTSMMCVEYLQDNSSSNSSGHDTSCVALPTDTEFFPSLYELRIGCMPKLEGWSRDLGGSPRYIKADFVEIWKCPRLTVMHPFSVPPKCSKSQVILHNVSEKLFHSIDWGSHPMVKIISIRDMVSLPTHIISVFPSELEVEDCDKWQKFWTDEGNQTQTRESLLLGFRRLESLSIDNCREMKHLSGGLRHLTKLESLRISRCSEELDCLHEEDEDGMPWKALQKLGELRIKGFENLEAIPKGLRHLPSLWRLEIVDCRSLKWGVDSLPMVKGLKYLLIYSCREMKYMSDGLRHLTELKTLRISRCSEELDCLHEEDKDGMPWKALQKLRSLGIKGFENLEAIPKGFRHLPPLDTLGIKYCESLKRGVDSLPIVENLRIKECPRFLEVLKREGLDFGVSGKTSWTEWSPRSKPSAPTEAAIASTSQMTRAPLPYLTCGARRDTQENDEHLEPAYL